MKTFILSYLTSVVLMSLYWLPSLKAAPLEVIPRVCIYAGFPLAIVLSIIVIAVSSLVKGSRQVTSKSPAIVEHEEQKMQLIEKKVA